MSQKQLLGFKMVFPNLTKLVSHPGHLQKQSTNPRPTPPSVTFRGEGHGDLQIDFMYHVNTDLLAAFHCDRQVSHRYKYKFLRATTSNIPSSVILDNRGSKLTIGRGGMLKVQHLVSVAKPAMPHPHVDSAGYQQPSRIAYIEFFAKPEVDEDDANDT
ncbi:hypothetical protein K7X08_020930 [Anisodus acutangulus]|uniref:Uncharacterized protein n=1 Tax=Anisodus acutangulus TaxID=402998 RepID=A0A9Q1MTS8_9SOLA|nr:hypothetical protein K7X08_020930 [Anisodus acutangulus]